MEIKPIAFFDSGIGGATILKDIMELLPNENYIYLPDSDNLPYGNKTKEELFEIVDNVVKKLIKYNRKRRKFISLFKGIVRQFYRC